MLELVEREGEPEREQGEDEDSVGGEEPGRDPRPVPDRGEAQRPGRAPGGRLGGARARVKGTTTRGRRSEDEGDAELAEGVLLFLEPGVAQLLEAGVVPEIDDGVVDLLAEPSVPLADADGPGLLLERLEECAGGGLVRRFQCW